MPAPSVFADHFDVPSPNGKQWPIVGTGARIRARTPPPPASTADRTSVGRGHCCIKRRFQTCSVCLQHAA